MSGRKIIDSLKDAVAGNFASVTIDGQRWMRVDVLSDGMRLDPLPTIPLRDWFAGQALAGLLGLPVGPSFQTIDAMTSYYASLAFTYSDAMLAARDAAKKSAEER